MNWARRLLANGRRWRRRYLVTSWLILILAVAAFPFAYAELHRTVHPIVLVLAWVAAVTTAARNVALAHLHTPTDPDNGED